MTGLVELWRTPRGTWRWRWHDASGASILANQSWDRIEEAHEAASRAQGRWWCSSRLRPRPPTCPRADASRGR